MKTTFASIVLMVFSAVVLTASAQQTEAQRLAAMAPEDFVFDLAAATAAQLPGGAEIRAANHGNFPVLQGLGVSNVLVKLGPCEGTRLWH